MNYLDYATKNCTTTNQTVLCAKQNKCSRRIPQIVKIIFTQGLSNANCESCKPIRYLLFWLILYLGGVQYFTMSMNT